MKEKRYNRMNKLLEIPKEVCSDIPKIIITGFDEILIENYKGILEYEEFFVRISTHIGIININGYNLNLDKMTDDDIKVRGKIEVGTNTSKEEMEALAKEIENVKKNIEGKEIVKVITIPSKLVNIVVK